MKKMLSVVSGMLFISGFICLIGLGGANIDFVNYLIVGFVGAVQVILSVLIEIILFGGTK